MYRIKKYLFIIEVDIIQFAYEKYSIIDILLLVQYKMIEDVFDSGKLKTLLVQDKKYICTYVLQEYFFLNLI